MYVKKQRISRMDQRVVLLMVIAVTGSLAYPELRSNGAEALDSMTQNPREKHQDTCNSTGCTNTASKILKYMDSRVNPCDNFYKFACGGFLNSTNIPDDKASIGEMEILIDVLFEQVRGIIEENIKEDELKPYRLTKTLYRMCMNTTAIEEQGLEPLKNILRELGGWPVLEAEDWKESDFSWEKPLHRLRARFGYLGKYLINPSVDIDTKNTSRNVITLDQAELAIPHAYLSNGLNDSFVKTYYDFMVDIAVILGAQKDRAEEELRKALEFEIELAKISWSPEKLVNQTLQYNPKTVKELSMEYPSIPWREYFNNLFPRNVQVNEEDVVIVRVPDFIKGLEILLNTTAKRVQANHAMWRFVNVFVSNLNEEVSTRVFNYTSVTTGTSQREPRWKECVGKILLDFPLSIGSMYVKKFFKEDAKKTAAEMTGDIKDQLKHILMQADWMDDKTRARALEKQAAMSVQIGYPDELLDDEKLEKFYENLEIDGGNYFESVVNLTSFSTDYLLSQLRKPVNESYWVKRLVAIINAYHFAKENRILIPAGILQGAFFSNDRPRYMNYGAIGFVIGHEITHGFDSQGRQFDKNGNVVDWWGSGAEQKYLEKAKCVAEQYGNYSVPEVGLNLNGNTTLAENIADNGGMKIAYSAYKEWVERNGPESQLPGLSYTAQQMFWISTAHCLCMKSRPQSLEMDITSSPSSPAEYRILGTLSNMKEFSQDFNCPVGSKMNPKEKCSVW